MHAFICKLTYGSLSSCAWGGGPVGKNSVVFKIWKSLEKKREGEERERVVDVETKRGKNDWGGGGRLLQLLPQNNAGVRSSY